MARKTLTDRDIKKAIREGNEISEGDGFGFRGSTKSFQSS